MTKEARLIFITALTVIFYALSIYLTQGAFIFPFPLNEAILLIVVLQYSYWHRAKRMLSLLILSIGVFSFLSNEVYWSFVLNDTQMHQFSNALYTDVFALLAALSILVFALLTLKHQKQILAQICTVLFIAGFIGSISFLPPNYTFLSLLMMATGVIINPVLKPFHMIWWLLLILEASKFITLFINN